MGPASVLHRRTGAKTLLTLQLQLRVRNRMQTTQS